MKAERKPARAPGSLAFVSAAAAAQAIQRREVSSVELTTETLKRIDRYNPAVNAVVTVDQEGALKRARAADLALSKGETWGPLHGVPCTIKDTLETAGLRTTAGSPALAKHVPTTDAAAVSRLRAAGAVILGKTNVPDMARDVQTYNAVFGTTHNPWDVTRTPGGSSGGEAAALAAGLSYLGLGSDLAGSLRIPAHFCGVYSHKPTVGVVPLQGHVPPLPGTPPAAQEDLMVVGLLARHAADLRLGLEVVGGPDASEAAAYRWSLPAPRKSKLADYRIGFVLDDARCPVAPEIRGLLADSVEVLRKQGVSVEEGWPQGVEPAHYDTFLYLMNSMSAHNLRDEQWESLAREARVQDGSYRAKRLLAWTAPHKHFLAATIGRAKLRARWGDYFRTHDAFLLPAAHLTAFPHDEGGEGASYLEERESRTLATHLGQRPYLDMRFWISFATLAGLPATTAPVGLARDGLPVGIQVIGPHLEDATSIDVAGKLTELIGGFKAPPGYLG